MRTPGISNTRAVGLGGGEFSGCVPPSRKNRKSITTWQDEVVLKELRDISHKTGIKQQEQIAE